jgi:NADH:quinone reductase (non-electrogenic)
VAKPVVLVVGGGFAGLEAAKVLARSQTVQVLLVDIANFALFSPMLPEVATGDIETRHILVPHRDILPAQAARQGRVIRIDHAQRLADVETTVMPRIDAIHYDHVVFTPGGTTNFFGVPGAESHALTFKTIGDAILLRNRILSLLERASVEPSAEGRERLCRVVIVGAGFSGVELAAALADFFHRAARKQYPELQHYLRVAVIEMLNEVTPMLPETLRRAVRRRLLASGVDLRLGVKVSAVTGDEVILGGGTVLPTLTTVWTAGVKPAEDLKNWNLPLDGKGRVIVDRELRVEGIPGAWAAGDAAAIPSPEGTAPPTAQHAVREGRLLARNILAELDGQPAHPFTYRTKGQLVSLGHRSGVGIVMGVLVRGFPAWWLWRTYYLLQLPTWLRRVRVALDWTIDLFFQKDVVELPMGSERREQ